MTVEQLLLSMSSVELSEWMAFHNIEPFGQEWLQTGVISSTVANAMSSSHHRLKPTDFMPLVERPPDVKETQSKFVEALKANGIEIIDTRKK